MPFKKGQVSNPKGRPKGSANKSTRQIIDMILKVATELQRSKNTSLKAMGIKDPQWFYEKILKMILPKNIEIQTDGTQKHELEIGPELKDMFNLVYEKSKKQKSRT